MSPHDDYPEDSELGGRPVIHNHYSQNRNGNGTGLVLKISLGLCGALLFILTAMTAFMWRDQITFQREMAGFAARTEARLDALERDGN